MSDASIRVLALLDELEELIQTSSKVPFSDKTIVNSDDVTSIIDDIRTSLPKDIQQAKWVKDEQDRILGEAKSEYDKVIIAAKKQAEYLVENDVIKKEAEKRAQALMTEAENHSRHMKLRAYEYIDKLLYDMQNDISNVAGDYIQPMNDYFGNMLSNMNAKVNSNRQEMKNMAEQIQAGETEKTTYTEAFEEEYEEEAPQEYIYDEPEEEY
jgi:hypothetical protein